MEDKQSEGVRKRAHTAARSGVKAGAAERLTADEAVHRLNAELERRVQQRTEQLEATNRELEAFCYSISHDLRAPLRAIRGFTEVLQEQYASQLDARGQDFLRRVCDASAQMDGLVEDLLKLSRASRGEIQTEDVDLSLLAAEIIAELRRSEPSRSMHVEIAPGLRAQGVLCLDCFRAVAQARRQRG